VRALSRLPDGAAKELAGDETLHAEPYTIRINDEFTVPPCIDKPSRAPTTHRGSFSTDLAPGVAADPGWCR
jgi:hypothetical protein